MSSSATGVGMPICFLWAILLILTQKSSQKFGDVLGIMINSKFLLRQYVQLGYSRGKSIRQRTPNFIQEELMQP